MHTWKPTWHPFNTCMHTGQGGKGGHGQPPPPAPWTSDDLEVFFLSPFPTTLLMLQVARHSTCWLMAHLFFSLFRLCHYWWLILRAAWPGSHPWAILDFAVPRGVLRPDVSLCVPQPVVAILRGLPIKHTRIASATSDIYLIVFEISPCPFYYSLLLWLCRRCHQRPGHKQDVRVVCTSAVVGWCR